MQTLRKLGNVLFLTGALSLFLFASGSARAQTYSQLRAQLLYTQTGPANPTDSKLVAADQRIYTNANTNFTSLNTMPSGTHPYLWIDLPHPTTNSSDMLISFARLNTIALAYATPGNPYSGMTSMATAVRSALDWLCANAYNSMNTGSAHYANWFDWEIASAQSLGFAAIDLYPTLTSAEISTYSSAISYFDPNPADCDGKVCTGSNQTDISLAVILAGALSENSNQIQSAVTALDKVIDFVASGDGIYQDGSYIQHGDVAYTGHYGRSALLDMGILLYSLNGTTWSITNPNITNVYNWPMNVYAPLFYQGAFMVDVSGRFITDAETADHRTGRDILNAMATVATFAGSAKNTIGAFAKLQVATDTVEDYYSSELGPFSIASLEALTNDMSTMEALPVTAAYTFGGMQRIAFDRPGFAFGIALFSPKISAFEYGNGDDIEGWNTGLGTTYLYTADEKQYDNNYFPTVNILRMAGTTTDSSTFTPNQFTLYPDADSWVGSSNIDNYASAGMQFSLKKVTGSTLAGQKSWFLFDNKMVSLGAGITSASPGNVETIVDNRQLNAAGDNALVLTNSSGTQITQPTALPTSSTSNVSWAWLDGNVDNSGIGYYFPGTASIYALREARMGEYVTIDPGGSTTPYTNNLLSLAFEHGSDPSGVGYAYAVLPNQTQASMATYAADPDFLVLSNTTALQAVKDTSANVTGASFWQSSGGTLSDEYGHWLLMPNQYASSTTHETTNTFDLGISDPTQANTSIQIKINRTATSVLSNDPAYTINQLSPYIMVTANTSGTVGRSLPISFAINSAKGTGSDVADAYVQDGTDANTNYGSSSALYVKSGSVGYNRITYMKFSTGNFSGQINHASVTLTPTLVDQSGITNAAYTVSDTGWSESTITFNNKPAIGTQITNWVVPTSGVVTFDVTTQAQAAQSGTGFFTIAIQSPTNQGNASVIYASKENSSAASRPVLSMSR